ncbi:MAG: DNA polymerase III subunit delta' [Alphaproteobacteria bacterium]|nr:DNA polymerase III subunit delta' [Alphaproteobacteria bacterium]
MEILPPSQTPLLLGHDEALRQIEDSYASGRMPHAWLIAGPEGIGKATLAYHIAHYVLAGGQNKLGQINLHHPASRLIVAEAHPDMYVLRRPLDEKTGALKGSIPVKEARKIAPFLHLTTTHGAWRVVLIDEAHTLDKPHGQNAILKAIEEPPPKTLILLTTTTLGILLPTIRSRCRVLPLQPLNEKSLRAILARSGVEEEEATLARIVSLSRGSVGFAFKLLQTEGLPLYEELLAILEGLPTLDMPRLHALADRLARKQDADSFSVIAYLLTDMLQQAVRAKAKGGAAENNFAARLVAEGSIDRAWQLWDKIRQNFIRADIANLDQKLSFINAITEIRNDIGSIN